MQHGHEMNEALLLEIRSKEMPIPTANTLNWGKDAISFALSEAFWDRQNQLFVHPRKFNKAISRARSLVREKKCCPPRSKNNVLEGHPHDIS
jgi:hypothetical protein